jgi:hypothetical protein
LSRAWRWIGALAAILLIALWVAHGLLLRAVAGGGGEAVGVALGPGTPPEQIALMLAFLGARMALFLGGPALAILALFGLLLRRPPEPGASEAG